MEAARPLHPDNVILAGDRLRVDALTVTDETAVRLARERVEAGEQIAPLVLQAIEIGARVLDREQTAADTDFVKAEFERQAREVEQQFGERARLAGEQLQRSVEAAFGAESGLLPQLMHKHFGSESSAAVQHQVRALVEELLRGHRETLAKQFTATDESNPLAQFQASTVRTIKSAADQQQQQLVAMGQAMSALQGEVAALKAERDKDEAVAQEAERGTAKGRTYEEQVAEALAEIASPRGDAAVAVGDRSDAGRSKKGDVVVDIGMCEGPSLGRIAFEAKDRKLSQPAAIRELDGALDARSADFAVLVVPSEGEVPAGMRALTEYHGDKLVVTWDPADDSPLTLEVAYMLARARVLLAREESGDQLDGAAIGLQADKALQSLKDARKVRSNLTSARNGIDAAGEVLDGIEKAVRGNLDEIRALLAAVGEVGEDADAEPDSPDGGLF